jgi:hypothetical protein
MDWIYGYNDVPCPPLFNNNSGEGGTCYITKDGYTYQSFVTYDRPKPVVAEEKHVGDLVTLSFACIAFSIALAIVVGTRIVWLKEIGTATYTKVLPPTKKTRQSAYKNKR